MLGVVRDDPRRLAHRVPGGVADRVPAGQRMTPALVLAGIVLLMAALLLVARKKRRIVAEKIEAIERTEEHEAILNALTEWLQEERVVRAMIENRVATRRGLVEVFAALPAYDEPKIKAVAACLLRDRNVRKVIAGHLEKQGIPRRDAMGPLLEWSRFEEAQSA
jgi:LPXTG-motif cell wall-anchored protein